MPFLKKNKTVSLCLLACVCLVCLVCAHSYMVVHLQLHWNPQIKIRSDINCIQKWKANSGIIKCQDNICSKEISDDEVRTRYFKTSIASMGSKKKKGKVNQSILGNISKNNCLWKFSRLKSSSNLGLLQSQTPSQEDMSVTGEFSV